MNKKLQLLLVAMLVVPTVTTSCVQTRASRNGVLNEMQYVRKDFLIRPAASTGQDPGWMMKATYTQVSSPNPLGGDMFGVSPGIDSGAIPFRFVVTENKLQMVSTHTIEDDSGDPNVTDTVVNAWPVQNVDLKYQVNLDGEVTNFFQTNQEAPWQDREWVKLDFSKNDMSDVAPFGLFTTDVINRCTDVGNSSATLVPGSFYYDTTNDYMQWTVNITVPISANDPNCAAAYGVLGEQALQLGHNNATFNVMYSMIRAKPLNDPSQTYQPLVVAEKDPIRHKYGFFETNTLTIDPTTELYASQAFVNRFDPQKPIVWYFSQGFPDWLKPAFNGTGGIADQTNAILEQAGVPARVSFVEYDANLAPGQQPRQYGDIRYSFLLWLSDEDSESTFIGVTPSVNDPRTGETISSSLTLSNWAFQDKYVERIDAFLQSIGASAGINSSGEWPAIPDGYTSATCQDGDTAPIISATVAAVHDGQASTYKYMQQYLNKPQAGFGNLGPQDFIVQQDYDFYHAFLALLPYQTFADPETNPYVTPQGTGGVFGPDAQWTNLEQEVQFQALAASIDQGNNPYTMPSGGGPAVINGALGFLNNFSSLTEAHKNYQYGRTWANGDSNASLHMVMDTEDILSFENVAQHAARHCINGAWETKEQWEANITTSFWEQVAFHEFGHAMGMTHNFMGSVDRFNFPTYTDAVGRTHTGNYTSSVMEYNAPIADVFEQEGWGPYDQGNIAWIYGNNTDSQNGMQNLASISGQNSPTSPWNDPNGFATTTANGTTTVTEKQFLMCNEYHMKYTPFCRQFDLGSSPSEIVANALDSYEWQYQWRNFRTYHKIWDDSAYANSPVALFQDLRKFMSVWVFDWSSGELADTLTRIGINKNYPNSQYTNSTDIEYLTELTNKFNADISMSNQLVAAYSMAMVQQSAGERPYATAYDPFYGDVVTQGIILDKLFATQAFVGLWPTDNYDQNQAGAYIANYEGFGDPTYNDVSQYVVTSMIGGNYDAYPYFYPLAVSQFAQDTHDINFEGDYSVRNWIGGWTFERVQDFLAYFQELAVQNNFVSADGTVNCTSSDINQCNYNPMLISDYDNRFVGPDGRRWIWAYLPDRNEYIAAQQDTNVASYTILQQYTDDLVNQLDDGAFPGGAFPDEIQVKYFIDAYNQFN